MEDMKVKQYQTPKFSLLSVGKEDIISTSGESFLRLLGSANISNKENSEVRGIDFGGWEVT